MRKPILSALALFAATIAAHAQSNPGLIRNQVPTAAQWNSYFSSKTDYLGFTPVNPSNITGTSPITITPVGTTGVNVSCSTCTSSSVTDHAVAIGTGGGSLNPAGPLTTGQLLIGVTGSDPVACSDCSIAGNFTAAAGGIIAGHSLISRGALQGANWAANQITLDHNGTTTARIYAWGPDASTNGILSLNTVRSDGTNTILSQQIYGDGHALFNAGIASTSTSNGSVVINGGLGLGGQINAGSSIHITPIADSARFFLDKPAGAFSNFLVGTTAGSLRWEILLGNATLETGSNAGSNFVIARLNDAGDTVLGTPIAIARDTGIVTFAQNITLTGSSSGTTVVAATAAASGTITIPAATDTLMGKSTPDVMTNKTLDTAGTGNVFKIAGTTITSISGNVAKVASATGALTVGDCVTIDANHNLIAAGGACTTGGAGGTVSIGTAGNLPYYAGTGTTVIGNANFNVAAGVLTLGIASSVQGGLIVAGNTDNQFSINTGVSAYTVLQFKSGITIFGGATSDDSLYLSGVTGVNIRIGSNNIASFQGTGTLYLGANGIGNGLLALEGTTSGQAVITAQAVAGTPTITVPTGSGTIATAASTGLVLNTTTGALTGDIATDTNVWSATANKLVDAAHINSAGAIIPLTPGTNVAVDMTTGINFSLAMGGPYTLSAPSGTVNGRSGCFVLTQDGTGGRTLAYNAVYKYAGGIAPVLSTAPAAVDLLCYFVKDSSNIMLTLNANMTH